MARVLLRQLRPLSSESVSSLTLRLQQTVDSWPIDTSKGERDIRIHLRQRCQELVSALQQDSVKATPLVKEEIASLTRLMQNHHRGKYGVPSGLGANEEAGGAPLIGATGLSLPEICRVLNTEDHRVPKRSLWSRVWRFFS
ncbi:unnamed protein product [Schistocephalus solidus]|uniref:Ubiquinol-cytochrome-c reductase complex assembly factor 2 n=1 Tax=Schistocephalus solidus TaxID=70667 RepID=A0A0V0J8L2_SCHSO|nr:unnamed protein product [Schistocephalus solidus]